MKKGATINIKLKSTISSHYYTTTKNSRNHPEKMECMKYDPEMRKRALYKETKIK